MKSQIILDSGRHQHNQGFDRQTVFKIGDRIFRLDVHYDSSYDIQTRCYLQLLSTNNEWTYVIKLDPYCFKDRESHTNSKYQSIDWEKFEKDAFAKAEKLSKAMEVTK